MLQKPTLKVRDPERKATMDEVCSNVAIEEYQMEGVAVIRNLLTPSWLSTLSNVIDSALQSPSPFALNNGDSSGKFVYDSFLWRSYEECRQYISYSGVAQIASAFMRSRKVNLLFDHLIVKEPGTQTPTAWHYESPYWPVKGKQLCSIWIALDQVSAVNGGLQFLRGSHLRVDQVITSAQREEGSPSEIVADVRNKLEEERLSIREWSMNAGDALIFDARTVHGAHGNYSETLRRRAYVVRFAGDDVVYRWHNSVPMMLCNPELENGSALSSTLFPEVTTEFPC